MYVDNL